ncbi:hypothetical protein GGD83_000050 [Rhodoblastus sphagnicola]|uniref:hypothetical protein n=1 Tax=Rhodoblastus sphagnicola TaxID=333368 RepID=UPI0011B0F0B4|nr:hypothetical protein [Rhodoblastus sphagnicola]MBB4196279.1 hypothetical protein [Rhodoblastus sphagnicola]
MVEAVVVGWAAARRGVWTVDQAPMRKWASFWSGSMARGEVDLAELQALVDSGFKKLIENACLSADSCKKAIKT